MTFPERVPSSVDTWNSLHHSPNREVPASREILEVGAACGRYEIAIGRLSWLCRFLTNGIRDLRKLWLRP